MTGKVTKAPRASHHRHPRNLIAASFMLLALAVLLIAPTDAQAACASPAGVAGQMQFDSSDNVMKYCDNTNWIEFPAVASAGGKPAMVDIDVGYWHSCGLLADGTVWCWGEGQGGVLGYDSSTDSLVPVQAGTTATSTLWSDWTQISVGDYHSCGIRSDGSAWCWGVSLGNGNSSGNKLVPARVGTSATSTLFSDWVTIESGQQVNCGVRSNGEAWCWGGNTYGEMGDGTTTHRYTPVRVGTSGTSTLWSDWESISPGDDHVCGIRTNGTLWCWGRALNGALGNGVTTDTNYTTPVQAGTATDWASVSAGNQGTCAIKDDGSAWCWGDGPGGASANTTSSITQVGSSGTSTLFYDWVEFYHGFYVACGRRSNNTVWCWGEDDSSGTYYGTLGIDGNAPDTDPFIPVQVEAVTGGPYLTDWASLDVGDYHSCGTRQDGSAWCWGRNGSGEHGNGTTVDNRLPAEVGIGETVTVSGKGQYYVKGGASPWTAAGTQTMEEGGSLLACISTLGTVTGVTWNGTALVEEASNTGSGINTYIYALHGTTAGTGSFTINVSGTVTLGVVLGYAEGLMASSLDKSASASGSSATPSSGVTATTSQSDELVFGCVGTNGDRFDAPGLWNWPLQHLQRYGTSGQGATSNVTASAGFARVTATGTYEAGKTGIASRGWSAVVTTYKATSAAEEGYGGGGGGGCSSPTGVAGMMLYDTTSNVLNYCNGGTWVEAGPNPGAGGAGCSSPSGAAGVMRYDSTNNKMVYCDGANWISIGK